MNVKELIVGLFVTLFIESATVLSVGSSEIMLVGFILTMVFILAFSCGMRLLVGCRTNDYSENKTTNWSGIGMYAIGATIATVGMFLWYFL